MTHRHPGRFARIGRRALVTTAVLIVPAATLGMASPALATEHHPKGEFAQFADCPLSNAKTEDCIYAKTESGKFIVGKQTVPIEKTITLQGGIYDEGGGQRFLGAEDGNTVSKTPQNVPGGLLDFVNCKEISNFLERIACELFFETGPTAVTATTELAAPATSIGISTEELLEEEGIALELPVKVHLENTFLGSGCYIGSNSAPIKIPFTTGTTSPPKPNEPIKGKAGHFKFNEAFTLATITENELVNNSFAAPGAEGCGGVFSFLIDPILDGKLGLPAAAGHNTARLAGTLAIGEAAAVKASE
jgi:hypothetical protein